ncbi:MAG: SOS response-associated peptidase [Bacillus subtilis]|nr:SOS response-associated peptidase [Bacillus subtilis]
MTVLSDGVRYRVGELKWGLVPPFASDPKIGYSMINAKSETLFEKPSYRASIAKKRCVILADGFYEWKTEGSQKIPHRIVLKDQKLFAMAGLWSAYQREDGSKLFTCTIITTQANPLVATIHDRMPVILEGANLKEWLDPNSFRPQSIGNPVDPVRFQ